MSLAEFIRAHHEEIIRSFSAFAKTLMPPGVEMTEEELRDHASEMLTAVVEDMHLRQTRRNSTGRRRAMAPPVRWKPREAARD